LGLGLGVRVGVRVRVRVRGGYPPSLGPHANPVAHHAGSNPNPDP